MVTILLLLPSGSWCPCKVIDERYRVVVLCDFFLYLLQQAKIYHICIDQTIKTAFAVRLQQQPISASQIFYLRSYQSKSMHNGSAAFSRLLRHLRQLVCANPIEYGIAAYSNSSKTEICISKIGPCEWINDSKGNKVMRIHGVIIFLLELRKKRKKRSTVFDT